jgi:DNA repair exonuclease SbcCD ATPase subunit
MSAKPYECQTCGQDDPNEFYVSKTKKKCKACITREMREKRAMDKADLATAASSPLSRYPFLQPRVYKENPVYAGILESLAARLESLNTVEMDEYPLESGQTWREHVNEGLERHRLAGDKIGSLDMRLQLIEKLFSENKTAVEENIVGVKTLIVAILEDLRTHKDQSEYFAEENERLKDDVFVLKDEHGKLKRHLEALTEERRRDREQIDNLIEERKRDQRLIDSLIEERSGLIEERKRDKERIDAIMTSFDDMKKVLNSLTRPKSPLLPQAPFVPITHPKPHVPFVPMNTPATQFRAASPQMKPFVPVTPPQMKPFIPANASSLDGK